MARLPLKHSVVKRLFALSGNACAYPSCSESMVNFNGTVIGEICHIEAAERNGQRYNEESNDDYRRSFDNLLLMCANHHKKTNDVEKYPTPKLAIFKSEHENKFRENKYSITDEIVEETIENYNLQFNNNLRSGTQINNQAKTLNIGTQIGSQNITNSVNSESSAERIISTKRTETIINLAEELSNLKFIVMDTSDSGNIMYPLPYFSIESTINQTRWMKLLDQPLLISCGFINKFPPFKYLDNPFITAILRDLIRELHFKPKSGVDKSIYLSKIRISCGQEPISEVFEPENVNYRTLRNFSQKLIELKFEIDKIIHGI